MNRKVVLATFMKRHAARLGVLTLGLVSQITPALGGSGSWNRTGSMNHTRLFNTATLLAHGKALAAGGEQCTFGYSSFNTIKNAQLFDPSTLTWTSTGTMVFSSEGQAMTLLSNGQVLSAGGESFNKALNWLVPITDARIYTP